jgi:hypothetical protein
LLFQDQECQEVSAYKEIDDFIDYYSEEEEYNDYYGLNEKDLLQLVISFFELTRKEIHLHILMF